VLSDVRVEDVGLANARQQDRLLVHRDDIERHPRRRRQFDRLQR
jgi:hypothetical protein